MQEASSLKHETGRQENKPEIHVIQFFCSGGGSGHYGFFFTFKLKPCPIDACEPFCKTTGQISGNKATW